MIIQMKVDIVNEDDSKVVESYMATFESDQHDYVLKGQIERFLNKALKEIMSESYRF